MMTIMISRSLQMALKFTVHNFRRLSSHRESIGCSSKTRPFIRFLLKVEEAELRGSESEISGLCEFSAALGNIELLNQLHDPQEIHGKNVCSRMKSDHSCGHSCDHSIEEEIRFIASHFCQLFLYFGHSSCLA
jgi:hypothetical protein